MVNLKQLSRSQRTSNINEPPLPTLATYQQPDNFGDYLRYLRRQARLTKTDLGIAVGYSPGQISLLESNQRSPNPTAVAALFLPALGIESDPHASNHLIALAHAAQEKNDTPSTRAQPANGVNVPQQVEAVIEKTLLPRPGDAHSLLELIPPEPVHAVERSKLLSRLQQWYQRERAVALCGLAGMGKSTLAAHFARGYAQTQPVLWLTLVADTNLSPEAILSRFDEALNWIEPPAPVGSGLDVEMMRGVIKGMALLGKGECEASRTAATQLAKRARHTGHLVCVAEAERLIELSESPPPVDELVRRVCCG